MAEIRRGRRASDAEWVPAACLAIFAVVWLGCAINPRYRDAWLLENLITLVAVPVAIVARHRFRVSNTAYVLVTAFLILHTIGSRYTYSEMPLGDWARDAFGLSRNHYDRLVHFSFGLLMLRPLRELTIRRPAALGRAATFLLSISVIAMWSTLYEIVEWWVAVVADPDAGTAFLGTQGDVWDAQWDMALALGGGLIAASIHLVRQSSGARAGEVAAHHRMLRVRTIRTRSVQIRR